MTFSRATFRKQLPLVLLVIGVIIVTSLAIRSARGAAAQSGNNKIQIAPALKTQQLNHELQIPVTDASGDELTRIAYLVESTEIRDELIVKGKRAVALKGRTFLILTIKVTNNYDKAIDMNTRDYIRLSVNGNETDLLAPEIHSDPVNVQAASTKYTRLGFPINETDSNLTLLIGLIKGEKETIVLNLQ